MFQYISINVLVIQCVWFATSVDYSSLHKVDETILQECKHFIPHLSTEQHKGDRGRIGVFGGSQEYTGGPYFGAMASLRTGADMVYVFCASAAAVPIKCNSPEMMVLPCLDSPNSFEQIKPWLLRVHGILVGPGLGRSESVTKTIIDMIEFLKDDDDGAIPMVFDADAFYILHSHPNLLKKYPNQVYLTPNLEEFKQLYSVLVGIKNLQDIDPREHLRVLADKLGPKVTVVLKGKNDLIAHGDLVVVNGMTGSPRRCGGQGDLLAGCLMTLAVWLDMAEFWRPRISITHEQLVGYAASAILKLANEMAYIEKGRSLLASDILQKLHLSFKTIFGD